VLQCADFRYTQTELEAELSKLKEEHLHAADLASQASEVCVRERVRGREIEREREVKERKERDRKREGDLFGLSVEKCVGVFMCVYECVYKCV